MIAYGYRKKKVTDQWETFGCNDQFIDPYHTLISTLKKLGYNYFIFIVKENKNGCL